MEKIPQVEKEEAAATFDPAAELERIKTLHGPERKAALEEYKEKLFAQKEDIAAIESRLIETFKTNPEVSAEALLETVAREMADARLSPLQKEIFTDAAGEAVRRHGALKELAERFPDHRELFHYLFGFYPSGRFRTSLEALNFRVVMDELPDAARVIADAFLEHRAPTKQELEETEAIGGKALTFTFADLPDHSAVAINNSPELKEAIEEAGTGWTQKKLVEHEEQHIWNTFFAATRLKKYFGEEIRNADEVLTPDEWIESYFCAARKYTAEWEYKNEILAFLKMGSAPEFIKEELELPGYSPACYQRLITEWLKDDIAKDYGADAYDKNKRAIVTTFQKTFGDELRQIVGSGLEAIAMLETAGIPRTELTLLLANEPLAGWKKFSTRYLAEKKKRLPPTK